MRAIIFKIISAYRYVLKVHMDNIMLKLKVAYVTNAIVAVYHAQVHLIKIV